VYVNLAKNKIKSLNVFCQEDMFPNLKWLDVSNNKITELPGIKLPKLEYLDIGFNKLEKVSEAWTGHPNLQTLKTVDNKFKSLAIFKALPKLENLFVANNQISTLNGWDQMPELRRLHIRRNKIEKMDEELPPHEKLESINLRSNKISSMDFIDRLLKWERLTDINVLNNPVETNVSSFNILVADVLARKPSMVRFCKHQIGEANRLEAWYFKQYKWQRSEEERYKREEEERKKAEAEANA
jgi:Leucine-rich repeat (LRR) protein